MEAKQQTERNGNESEVCCGWNGATGWPRNSIICFHYHSIKFFHFFIAAREYKKYYNCIFSIECNLRKHGAVTNQTTWNSIQRHWISLIVWFGWPAVFMGGAINNSPFHSANLWMKLRELFDCEVYLRSWREQINKFNLFIALSGRRKIEFVYLGLPRSIWLLGAPLASSADKAGNANKNQRNSFKFLVVCCLACFAAADSSLSLPSLLLCWMNCLCFSSCLLSSSLWASCLGRRPGP